MFFVIYTFVFPVVKAIVKLEIKYGFKYSAHRVLKSILEVCRYMYIEILFENTVCNEDGKIMDSNNIGIYSARKIKEILGG